MPTRTLTRLCALPVAYTAATPLPDGQRDTLQLSFTVPDAEGEILPAVTGDDDSSATLGWIGLGAGGLALARTRATS